MCKDEIRKGIKVVHSSEGFIWVKLEHNFFGLIEDIYLCAAYIPPEYTTKQINQRTDYFQNLTESLTKFSTKGQILITGDLNARIGFDKIDNEFEIPILEKIGHTGWANFYKMK